MQYIGKRLQKIIGIEGEGQGEDQHLMRPEFYIVSYCSITQSCPVTTSTCLPLVFNAFSQVIWLKSGLSYPPTLFKEHRIVKHSLTGDENG